MDNESKIKTFTVFDSCLLPLNPGSVILAFGALKLLKLYSKEFHFIIFYLLLLEHSLLCSAVKLSCITEF